MNYKKELKKMFNENYKEPGNIIFEIRITHLQLTQMTS